MDFKIKGKSWVGNIYHQFESICHDVDDFMSKDTLRFVENQVQNVGVGVKKLYSHVVQDILPPLEDKFEAKSLVVPDNWVDIVDTVESATGTKSKSTPDIDRIFPLEQVPIDYLRNLNESSQVRGDHIKQYEPFRENPSQKTKNYLRVREDVDVVSWNDAFGFDEENMTDGSIPVIDNASSDNNSVTLKSYEDHEISMSAMASSPTNHDGLLDVAQEKISCNSFVEDSESLSVVSRSTISDGPDSYESRSIYPSPVTSLYKTHEASNLNMEPPCSSACDAAQSPLEKDGTLFDSVSTKDEQFDVSSPDHSLDVSSPVKSPDLAFSYFSCDDEETQIGLISSNCSTIQKFPDTLEPAPEILGQLVDHIHCSSPESKGRTDILPLLSATEIDATKCSDTTDYDDLTTHGPSAEVASLDNIHEQCHKDVLLNSMTSPSETGSSDASSVGATDIDMETVDLSPKAKPDGTIVASNINFVHPMYYRRRNFRYYKKLIQDAFASRKRLSKEYEHLPILYGDIDTDSGLHSLPSSPVLPVQTGRTLSFHETCESEWELL